MSDVVKAGSGVDGTTYISELRINELINDMHDLDLPEAQKMGLIEDISVIAMINGTPDPALQMNKRILYSICRNTIQLAKQRADDKATHLNECPLSKTKSVVENGVTIPPLEIAIREVLSDNAKASEASSSILFTLPVIGPVLQGKGRAATVIAAVVTVMACILFVMYIQNKNFRSAVKTELRAAVVERAECVSPDGGK